MAKLVLTFQGVLIKEYPLDKPLVTIGRREGNDVCIDHMTVSGAHAKVERGEGGFVLTDLGSSNGTFVNGVRVTQVVLRPNDWISIGKHVLHFKDSLRDPRAAGETLETQVN